MAIINWSFRKLNCFDQSFQIRSIMTLLQVKGLDQRSTVKGSPGIRQVESTKLPIPLHTRTFHINIENPLFLRLPS